MKPPTTFAAGPRGVVPTEVAASTLHYVLPLVTFVPQPPDAASSGVGRELAKTLDPSVRLSADQAELVRICETLGLRKQDFAVELNIGLSRLSSYLYGRTLDVPEEVMRDARRLLAEQSSGASSLRSELAQPMSVLISEWKRRLGVHTDAEMGGLLGVSMMTIHRWKTDAVRPDRTALVRYASIVEALRSRALKAHEGGGRTK